VEKYATQSGELPYLEWRLKWRITLPGVESYAIYSGELPYPEWRITLPGVEKYCMTWKIHGIIYIILSVVSLCSA